MQRQFTKITTCCFIVKEKVKKYSKLVLKLQCFSLAGIQAAGESSGGNCNYC